MSDPRYTDPDPRLSDPVLRRDDSGSGIWGWIAGIAVLVLIAFVVIAGWNGSQNNTASNTSSPPATTGQATPGATPGTAPPSTTGSGGTSPQSPANHGQ
ncbi:hypothetical protein MXD81_63505 [Microbacteriaceae bacterium K1510]|nr:hypothetical protein [Microbacteriaceae bacterium K1510]